MVSDVEITHDSALPSRSERGTPTRRIHYQSLTLPLLHRARSSINRLGGTTTLNLLKKSGPELLARAPRWRDLWSLPAMMAVGRSYEGSTGRRVVAVQDHSVSQSSRRATADQDDLKFGFGNLIPFAPIQPLSPKLGFQESRTGPAPRPAAAGSGETFMEQLPLSASEQRSSLQSVSSEHQLTSSDRDGTSGGDQPKHSRSTVSTLHIDGSALGRWTVQHLERALSKPSTGMTGVDPRAALPRSRVAPF